MMTENERNDTRAQGIYTPTPASQGEGFSSGKAFQKRDIGGAVEFGQQAMKEKSKGAMSKWDTATSAS